MGLFLDCFGELPDPRRGNARRHDLLELLTIALSATLCGAASCVDFELFACHLIRSTLPRRRSADPSTITPSRLVFAVTKHRHAHEHRPTQGKLRPQPPSIVGKTCPSTRHAGSGTSSRHLRP